MDPGVDRVLKEARDRGIAIGKKLGDGGYCEAWAVGDALVMRIPRARDTDVTQRGVGPIIGEHVSPTGPFSFSGIENPELARTLFDAAIERERDVVCDVLARFVDRLELADTPVSLHERAPGVALSTVSDVRPLLTPIARALSTLHRRFGFHGDLKPEHIFVDGERITFIDPLPVDKGSVLVGSLGYSLPTLVMNADDVRDEGWLWRDLAGLAQIAADAYAVDLGFDVTLWYAMVGSGTGYFNRNWDAPGVLAEMQQRITSIPLADIARTWIDRVCTGVFSAYIPMLQPYRPGSATPLLDELARPEHERFQRVRHEFATVLHQPDAAMWLLEAETTPPSDPHALANILGARGRFERAEAVAHGFREQFTRCYGTTSAPPQPIEHPPGFPAAAMRLRMVLVDLARLCDPASYDPDTTAELAGSFPRIFDSLDALRDEAAYRAYVEYLRWRGPRQGVMEPCV